MKSNHPRHVAYDTNVHDVYASRNLDYFRKFLCPETVRKASADQGTPFESQTPTGGSMSLLTHKLPRSPSAVNGFKSSSSGGSQYISSGVVNRKDLLGRTVLHKLAASENEEEALLWLKLLAKHPFLQLNLTDDESGWTALHRALYRGNLRFAKTLIDELGCEVNIKDHEGLSPFELYNLTINGTGPSTPLSGVATEGTVRTDLFTWGSNRNFVLGIQDDGDRSYPERIHLRRVNSPNAGTMDWASRAPFNRFSSNPVLLVAMSRLHTALITTDGELRVCGFGTGGRLGLGTGASINADGTSATAETQFTFASVKGGTLADQKIKSVALGQDHTVVVTDDGKVFTFGTNRFGQLGYEKTPETKLGSSQEEIVQLEPKLVTGLLKKQIVLGAAASKWHTAVFTCDSLFTFGAHRGQLGYSCSNAGKQSLSIQSTPKRVPNVNVPISQLSCTDYATAYLCQTSNDVFVIKSETCVRVIFGFVRFPSDMQVSGLLSHDHGQQRASRIVEIDASGQTLAAVSSVGDVYAIDLENGSPLESEVTRRPNPDGTPTHPMNGRSTYKPRRVWTSTKLSTTAQHAAVGTDGTIIISTLSGHGYIGCKLPEASKGSDIRTAERPSGASRKHYKFQKVPHIQRIVGVFANSAGSYAAIREDVPLKEIRQHSADDSLPSALVKMLSHLKKGAGSVPELHEVPLLSPPKLPFNHLVESRRASFDLRGLNNDPDSDDVLSDHDEDEENDSLIWDVRVGCALFGLSLNWTCHPENQWSHDGDLLVVAESGEQVLVHQFVLCSRSNILHQIVSGALVAQDIRYHPAADSDKREGTCHRLPTLRFQRHSLLTLLIFIHYLYTDTFPSLWDGRVWPHVEKAHKDMLKTPPNTQPKPSLVQMLAEVKASLKQLAINTNLPALAQSLTGIGKSTPQASLSDHFRGSLQALGSVDYPSNDTVDAQSAAGSLLNGDLATSASSSLKPDIELELAEGESLGCHSILMRAQCPFFRLMFDHEAWVTNRRQLMSAANNHCIRIDMGHLTKKVMQVVLQHIYTDDHSTLFVIEDFDSMDEYIDFVFEVLAAANELMMDKLKWVCSTMLRRCINLTNVTAIAAEAEFYQADLLKETCMNYMVCSLETIFQDKGLINIPNELLISISEYLKRSQVCKSPVSRSPKAMADLLSRHSEFLSELDLPKPRVGMAPRSRRSFIKSQTSLGPAVSHRHGIDASVKGGGMPNEATFRADAHHSSSFTSPASLTSFLNISCSLPKDDACSPSIASPQDAGTPTTPPHSQPSNPVQEVEDDSAPFVMDDLDDAPSAIARVEHSHFNASAVNRSAWATPIKKPAPINLRSIMSAERPRGSAFGGQFAAVGEYLGSSSLRLPTEPAANHKLSQREKRRQSLEASKKATELLSSASIVPQTKAPAWRAISSGNWKTPESAKRPPSSQIINSPTSASGISPVALTGTRVVADHQGTSPAQHNGPRIVKPTTPVSQSASSPVHAVVRETLPKKVEQADPASAIGAPVITPTRVPLSASGISASVSFRRTLGGQDTPWTNYASASASSFYTTALRSTQQGTFSFALADECEESPSGQQINSIEAAHSGAEGAKASLLVIQHQQATERWALRGKAKPNLVKIQEEENLRQQEQKQEEQFLKWFEEESKKLQQQEGQQHKPGRRVDGKKPGGGGGKDKRNDVSKGRGGSNPAGHQANKGKDVVYQREKPMSSKSNQAVGQEPNQASSSNSKGKKKQSTDAKTSHNIPHSSLGVKAN